MAAVKKAIQAMEENMSRESIHRANPGRFKQVVKQTEMSSFTQAAVSKLEKRKDMKISTLIEYLQDIGMGLEIKVFPKKGPHAVEELTLLKLCGRKC